MDDINRTILGGAEHVPALDNGSIDASITTEPLVTQAVETGAAVRFAGTDAVYPGQQIGVMIYGEEFAAGQTDTAEAFMRAFLRGARDYNDAIEDGVLAGEGSDEVIDILVEATSMERDVLATMTSHGIDPDGQLNLEGLADDLEFWRAGGYLEDESITVDEAVDMSFVDAAVEALGEYESEE